MSRWGRKAHGRHAAGRADDGGVALLERPEPASAPPAPVGAPAAEPAAGEPVHLQPDVAAAPEPLGAGPVVAEPVVGLGFRDGGEYVLLASDAAVSSLVGLAEELVPPPASTAAPAAPDVPTAPTAPAAEVAALPPVEVRSYDHPDVPSPTPVRRLRAEVATPVPFACPVDDVPESDTEPMVSLAELRLPTAEEMVGSHQAPPEGAVVIDVPHTTQLPAIPQRVAAPSRWQKLLRALGIRR